MVNKSLLPVRFRPPVLGECVFFTRGLKYNFELIFFWGPGVSMFGVHYRLYEVSYLHANNEIFACLSRFRITKESSLDLPCCFCLAVL